MFHFVKCHWQILSRGRKVFFPACCCITAVWISHTHCASVSRCAVFCCRFLGSSFFKKPAKMKPEGKKLLNIIILGFSFMFLFTAFQTCGNIEVSFLKQILDQSHIPSDKTHSFFLAIFQQTVIKSFNSTEFHGSGYTRWRLPQSDTLVSVISLASHNVTLKS